MKNTARKGMSVGAFWASYSNCGHSNVIALPPTETQEAHDRTPTCSAARDAHWTAHTLACRANRDLVVVQRKAVRS